MKRKLIIILFMMPLACSNGVNDLIDNLGRDVPICVKSGATGTGDGRGWANAYTTIQEAVAVAKEGDEIWVAGTFTIEFLDLTIDEKVYLYGGFNGTESERDERDPAARTIIQIDDLPIIIQSSDVVMEGFQITGTHAPIPAVRLTAPNHVIFKNCYFVSNSSVNPGSAIYCSGGTIIINGCTFDANYTTSGSGGAIYCENSSTIEITDTTFTGNYTQNGGVVGGAIYCKGSSLIITGSTFDSNNAGGYGGAIYCESLSSIEITDTTFTGNHTPAGGYFGGAIYCSASSLVITGCTFDGNKTNGGNGGAIYCADLSDLQINATIFKNNTAQNTGSSYGGAIDADSGSLTIDKCTFQSNTGPWGGGAIRSRNGNNLTIIGTLFKSNNTSDYYGGAVYSDSSTLIVINSVFNSNRTGQTDTSTGSHGGAIYIYGTPNDIIVNSIFFNNGTGTYVGAIYNIAATNMYVYNCIFFQNKGTAVSAISGGTVVAYNNAWDDGETLGYVELTSPPFVSTTTGSEDFRLAAGSNCIDAGCPVDIPGFTMPSTDFTGNPRTVGTIDIGAYERQ